MAHDYSKKASGSSAGSSKLEMEDSFLDFAFKASNVGYWAWDTQTGYVYFNDTTMKMLHLSKSDFKNNIEDIKPLIHPDDYDVLKHSLNQHIDDKSFFEIEFRIRRPDMSYIWINIDGRSAHDAAGEFLRVGGSVVNASAYVDLKEQLVQEKRYLRLIFDNVPARIWLKDAHNKIIRLNNQAAASMNLPISEVEGADTYDLFPNLAKQYHEADLAVINSGQPLKGIIEEYAPKDGPHGWVSTDKFPFTHPDTHEKHVLVIATDITQQKKYETEILVNSERLRQANKDLDHFAYMASHDLKAPLRGMDDLATWIEEDLGENITPDIKQKLDLFHGRLNRMQALLKDILAFSRAGKNMAKPEDIDMTQLIDEIVGWLPLSVGFKFIKETDFPTLSLPRSVVEHIFLNLLSNALKHHDQEQGTIKIGCIDREKYHMFYVSDDGPGIPEEHQENVFEIFKKLKRRDEVEGSGIGLAIVKKMTEALAGTVEIISSPDARGTTFNILIPKA